MDGRTDELCGRDYFHLVVLLVYELQSQVNETIPQSREIIKYLSRNVFIYGLFLQMCLSSLDLREGKGMYEFNRNNPEISSSFAIIADDHGGHEGLTA